MFSKRNQLDVKKSTSKIQDPKKDLATKIKHLKIILGKVSIEFIPMNWSMYRYQSYSSPLTIFTVVLLLNSNS